MLLLIRLERQETDIVITVSVPHGSGEYRTEDIDLSALNSGPALDIGQAIRQNILETFEVRDWSLFVNEEGQSR